MISMVPHTGYCVHDEEPENDHIQGLKTLCSEWNAGCLCIMQET